MIFQHCFTDLLSPGTSYQKAPTWVSLDQGSNCVVCRRFLATDHLSVLLDYLTSEGYRRGHYKVGFLSLTYRSPTDMFNICLRFSLPGPEGTWPSWPMTAAYWISSCAPRRLSLWNRSTQGTRTLSNVERRTRCFLVRDLLTRQNEKNREKDVGEKIVIGVVDFF